MSRTTPVFACALLAAALVSAPREATLLVLEKGASSLDFYDDAGHLLGGVPVGQHPHEMVLSADKRTVYTTDNGTMRIEQPGTGGNEVSIIDLPGRKRTGTISLGKFRRPHGIDIDPSTGHLAVTCELPDRLLILNPQSRAVLKTYDTKGKTSHMVAFGRDARWAYVSNATSANVSAINLANGEVKLIATAKRPEGSVLSPDGTRLYVCNREGRAISVIDTDKQTLVGTIATGNDPVRVGVTPDGKLLVYALKEDKAIDFADPVSRHVIGSVKLDGEPVSLHLSADGRIAYAAAEESDTVYVVSVPERKLLRQFKTRAGASPDPVIPFPASFKIAGVL